MIRIEKYTVINSITIIKIENLRLGGEIVNPVTSVPDSAIKSGDIKYLSTINKYKIARPGLFL